MKERKTLRLKSHDYSRPGSYFITTCVLNHQRYFGDIRDGKMIYNQSGKIAMQQLKWLSDNYSSVDVKIYMVMPNHVHAIIDLKPAKDDIKPISIPQLMGAYKTRVSAAIHKLGLKEFTWQRSYYDHIIRNMESYQNIAEYIKNNPLNWNKDRFYNHKPPD
jgi:putative transposase